MRIYSIIIMAIGLILNLLTVLKSDSKSSRIAAFLSFLLYLPVWVYIL